ncbi:MAG: hypothetical protein AB1491_00150 [Thermodesulfobacteriota bacterium]
MTHEILDNSGAPVDMVTGRPLVETRPGTEEAKVRHFQAVQDSRALLTELQASPLLALLVKKYSDRLELLARNDQQCVALEEVIRELHGKIELIPRMAEERLRKLMGKELFQTYRQTQEKGAAPPDGIPA